MNEELTYMRYGVRMVENPEEKQAHFDDLDELAHHVKGQMRKLYFDTNENWIQQVRLVSDYIIRWCRYEKWVQEANTENPGFYQKTLTRIVLMYALYGDYPGISSVVTDFLGSMKKNDELSELIAYKITKDMDKLPASSRALWTLWDDVCIFIDQNADKYTSDMQYLLFATLAMNNDEQLLAGNEITSSEPAEKALKSLQELHSLTH